MCAWGDFNRTRRGNIHNFYTCHVRHIRGRDDIPPSSPRHPGRDNHCCYPLLFLQPLLPPTSFFYNIIPRPYSVSPGHRREALHHLRA